MSIRSLVAVIVVLAVIIITFLSVDISGIFDLPYLVLIIGGTVSVSLIAVRPSEMFKSLFSKSKVNLNRTTVEFLGNSVILVGAVGTFMGLIIMLSNLDNPDMLIPAIVAAFVPLGYGFCLKFLIDSCEKDINIHEKIEDNTAEKKVVSKYSTILGIFLFEIILLFIISLKESISVIMLFVSPTAFFICVIGGFAAALIGNSFKDILNSFKGSFGGTYSTLEEARKAVKVASNMYNRFISFGFIGAIIGLLAMFSNLDNPDELGPGMALALIAFLYAIIISLFIISFGTAARRQVNLFGEDQKLNLMIPPVGLAIISIALCLTSFSVLLSSFSKM